MQQQALARCRRGYGIEAVADDRVPERGHVHAQLMAAVRSRVSAIQAVRAGRFASRETTVVRGGRFAQLMDSPFVAAGWASRRSAADRPCHASLASQRSPPLTALCTLPLFRRRGRARCARCRAKHHQSGGFHVEPVHDQRIPGNSCFARGR